MNAMDAEGSQASACFSAQFVVCKAFRVYGCGAGGFQGFES